jgi:hypothetical protein
MKSEVQVLPGPPTIPAGHSAVGNQPGTLAASLGRAGAAPHPWPAPRAGGHPDGPPPRPPPTVVAQPARGHQPRGRCGQLAPGPAPCPRRYRQPQAAPHAGLACLVAQRAGAAAAARLTPGRVRHRHPTDHRTTSAAPSVPRAPRLAAQPPEVRPPQGPRPVAVVRVARPPRPGSHASAGGWEETDATGQRGWTVGGWTPDGWTARAGRWTGGQQPAGSADPGRRTRVTGHRRGRTPDGWTAGSRTTNRLGGHRMPDTSDRRRGGVLAVSITATCRSAGGPLRLRWAGAGWAAYDQERSAARTTRAPRCPGRARAPPRRLAAGGTPPSSWRLGALLSSDDFGSRVGRRGGCHPVYGEDGEVPMVLTDTR